jgi:hypothetical protein
MKKIVHVFALVAAMLSGTAAFAQGPALPPPENKAQYVQVADPDSEIVYVTRYGKRYHRGSCRYADGGYPVRLAYAVHAGFTPCRVCHPPAY